MTTNESQSGLRIWERVQTTDPAYTRRFQRASGFEGTAINPTYLVRKATEIFGPFGIGWGVELISEQYVQGHAIAFPANGGDPTYATIHIGRYELWYELGGKRGSIKHYGQTTFVGKTADGKVYTNEEAPKMSQTDAMCKALSMLGFAADVHIGLYDDSKYVSDLEAAFAAGMQPTGTTPADGMTDASTNGGAQQGQSGQAELSARYHQYKERLRQGQIDDLATAREIIKSDALLNDFERALLLTAPELKTNDNDAASAEAKPARDGKRGKGPANASEEAFL